MEVDNVTPPSQRVAAAAAGAGVPSFDSDDDATVPRVRSVAFARVCALQDAAATEMVQLQNLQLRQRLAALSASASASASGAGGSSSGAGGSVQAPVEVLACGDTVSTPYGDGIVLAQRDSDRQTTVKLQWGAVAVLNDDSVALLFRAGEVRPCAAYAVTSSRSLVQTLFAVTHVARTQLFISAALYPSACAVLQVEPIGSSDGSRPLPVSLGAAGPAVPGPLLRPRLVFGPVSRWERACGRRVSAAAVRGDSIIVGMYGTSTAATAAANMKHGAALARASAGHSKVWT